MNELGFEARCLILHLQGDFHELAERAVPHYIYQNSGSSPHINSEDIPSFLL